MEGFQELAQVMTDYYQKLLGKQKTNGVIMDQEVTQQGPKLSIEQQIRLNDSFTDLEIKEAIFFIPNAKTPGPDGFSSGFFKQCWHKIGPKVIKAMQEFFRNGKLLKECNTTTWCSFQRCSILVMQVNLDQSHAVMWYTSVYLNS